MHAEATKWEPVLKAADIRAQWGSSHEDRRAGHDPAARRLARRDQGGARV